MRESDPVPMPAYIIMVSQHHMLAETKANLSTSISTSTRRDTGQTNTRQRPEYRHRGKYLRFCVGLIYKDLFVGWVGVAHGEHLLVELKGLQYMTYEIKIFKYIIHIYEIKIHNSIWDRYMYIT